MHPATKQLLRWFECAHLPTHLMVAALPFRDLANIVVYELALTGAEATTALRKLLEAKDCAVRAAVEKHQTTNNDPQEGIQ